MDFILNILGDNSVEGSADSVPMMVEVFLAPRP